MISINMILFLKISNQSPLENPNRNHSFGTIESERGVEKNGILTRSQKFLHALPSSILRLKKKVF